MISAALTLVALAAVSEPPAAAQHLLSPSRRIEVIVTPGPALSYDVLFDGHLLLRAATLSLDVDGVRLGATPRVTGVRRSHVDRVIEPPVPQTAAVLEERFNELRLDCAGHYAVVFRAYDLGVAYRFETALPRASVKITGETASFPFVGDANVFYPHEDSFFSHNERTFKRQRLADVHLGELASIPAVVETAAGPKVAIADADIDDYPGLWLRGTGGNALTATFPPYPLEEKLTKDRDFRVTRGADYLAVTRGTRSFPWRVLGVAEKDVDLVGNPLCYLLARPSQIADTSWIHPGKVAWDWWNALNLRGVPFKPGVNTETYQAYIDFAAQYGLQYVILDEGWYRPGDLLAVVPEIDMPRLLAYARAKKVGVILWAVWKTLDDQFQPALAQFEKWGIAGLKVDFMQRDDQPVIAFYQRVCRELAKRKMLVDFHGGIRAVLLTRTWPNLLTTEGVQGLEHDKWSNATDPDHDATLPFTRMFLGPMDYTPGAMHNADRAHFKSIFKAPMSQGTRSHQLAMYVVYESPLQMLADSPSNYLAEPDAMAFLGPVPSVWDETRVLDGKIGEYVVVARRRGTTWYLGALTNWTGRELQIDTSFLGGGEWKVSAWTDPPDHPAVGDECHRTSGTFTAGAPARFTLAAGGGLAAVLVPAAAPTKTSPPK
jgi:alpha-glucosidase